MLKKFLLISIAWAGLSGVATAQTEQVPAGYVMSVDLQGEDAALKTAILRDGKELAPKLMMPLYEKDIIFLRDAKSKIAIDVNNGTETEISGRNARFEVSGEVATGDDAWSLIVAVAGVIGGGDESAIPDNMVTRGDGDELKIPMAVRGPNFIVNGEPKLWLAWAGGKAPYKVIVDIDGRAKVTDKLQAQEFEFEAPPVDAKRFTVTVKDSGGRIAKVLMRYRNGLPDPPESLKAKMGTGEAKDIIYASWLTSLHEGDWSIEAAQILRKRPKSDAAAKTLLERIAQGWKYNN